MPADRSTVFALIVEDHPLVADSLVACIRSCDAQLEVKIAGSVLQALQILERWSAPLLIVTDLMLTDAGGVEVMRRLRAAAPHIPLLVFTAFDDPALRSEAAQHGVFGYLIKSTSVQELRDAIRSAIGERSVRPRVAPVGNANLRRLLTPKQIGVLEELTAGRSNKEIALRLNIRDETVGSHMKEILGRLGVRNRTEAVVRYFQLIEQSDGHG